MPSFNKSKILGVLLIAFGLGVPGIFLSLLFTEGQINNPTASIHVGLILLLATAIPLWIVIIISGIYAIIGEAYKFVIFGTILSLVYCCPIISMTIIYGGALSLYWILSGISVAALIFVITARGDFR